MNRCDPDSSIRRAAERFGPYATRLQAIFADMDLAYRAVAERVGFHCSGCPQNCCRTRFYHHTYLEWCLLANGFRQLDHIQQADLRRRANDVCRQVAPGRSGQKTSWPMCPLNRDGLCELYDCRPMICRLHGIPHALQRPDGKTMFGPGCDDFYRQCQSPGSGVLNRTPHYGALAALEQEFCRTVGLTQRPKLTVAEMMLRMDS